MARRWRGSADGGLYFCAPSHHSAQSRTYFFDRMLFGLRIFFPSASGDGRLCRCKCAQPNFYQPLLAPQALRYCQPGASPRGVPISARSRGDLNSWGDGPGCHETAPAALSRHISAAWLTQNGVRCRKDRLIVVIGQSSKEMANPAERLAQK